MTTDTTALQERIARALDKNFNPDRYPIMAAMFMDYAAAALPIVEAEVQAARVEAWQDGHTAGFEDALLACGRAAGFKPGPPLGPTSNPYREDPTR